MPKISPISMSHWIPFCGQRRGCRVPPLKRNARDWPATFWRAVLFIVALGIGMGWSSQAQTVTFDLDTGTPPMNTYYSMPPSQTSGGIVALLGAPSGGFSVQTASTLGAAGRLSLFSGHILASTGAGSILEIQFSRRMTNIVLKFATIQVQPIEIETPVQLIAYSNSIATPVGSTNVAGVYGGPTGNDAFPMGTLTFQSATPFDLVRISVPQLVPPQSTGQAYDFLVDNIAVQVAGGVACTITTSSSPTGGGATTGGGTYDSGLGATVVATPNANYSFVNWTENSAEVSATPSYTFTASTNRTLVANFVRTYTITTRSSPTNGGATIGGGVYPTGSNVTVIAAPNSGFAFLNWTENSAIAGTSTNFNLIVASNRTLTANFVLIPQLHTLRTPTNTVVVSWPSPSSGFVPQQNALCHRTNWVDMTNAIEVVNGRNQVVIAPPPTNCFFRLIHP